MNTRSRKLAYALVGALVLSACSDTSTPVGPDAPAQLARSAQATVDVIVALNPAFAPGGHAANQERAAEVARGLGAAPSHAYGTALFGFAASIPEGRLAALDRDPRVAYWERDQVASIPLPRAAAPPWCPDNPSHPACSGEEEDPGSGGQVTPWGVTRVGGAAAAAGTAWVIDTGVDLDHPDLNVDVGRSRNFASRGKDSPDDGHGHGTHVAGTIGAIDNSAGVVGVAAGATIVAVRVLDNSGSGFYSDIIAGVDYAADNSAAGDVANMSLGGPPSNALDNAVLAAANEGLKFSLAAGNSDEDANGSSPARVNHANVRTVSAIDKNDCLASFSNWGNPPVDFAAPGVGVLSTWKGGRTNTISGTSMAAPHVAGLWLSGWNGTKGDGEACSGSDPDGSPDPIAHR
jgi:hypothetical protein